MDGGLIQRPLKVPRHAEVPGRDGDAHEVPRNAIRLDGALVEGGRLLLIAAAASDDRQVVQDGRGLAGVPLALGDDAAGFVERGRVRVTPLLDGYRPQASQGE